jgi:hypothetical protein
MTAFGEFFRDVYQPLVYAICARYRLTATVEARNRTLAANPTGQLAVSMTLTERGSLVGVWRAKQARVAGA